MKFPASFRTKMMAENGGEVATPPDAWILYPFYDTSDRKRIARTCNDIGRETESARKWTGFPPDAIAIGSNGGGDQLILLRSSSDSSILDPGVFWWDQETGEIQPVAKDFAELSSP